MMTPSSPRGLYFTGKLFLALLLVVGLMVAQKGHAQGLGRIVGTVTDASGAAVPAAQITVTQTATGATTSAKSDGSGGYVFPSLPPAAYSLQVSAQGFTNYVQKGIVLQADAAATVNIVLKVGAASETVTVTSNAAQVDTSTATLSQVVGERQVNDLPLNGRNAASLTTLVAGVVPAPSGASDQGNQKTFPVVVNISANGTRANQTNYMLDGGNNVDEYTNVNAPFPFPDALQEFSVQTDNYAAEYGQNAGAVVNVLTKSGSSEFHGNLFEYLRNAVFNAPNYFGYLRNPVTNQYVKTVDPLKRNQFGGTIGGPVEIPGLFKMQHSFFFGGYQKTISHDQTFAASSSTLPTTAQLQGNFAGSAQVINPVTGLPYVGNQIPVSQFNSSALALLKDLPAVSGSVSFRKPVFQTLNEGLARLDQDIGGKDHIVARYYLDKFHLNGVLDPRNLLTYTDGSDITYQNALLSEAHIFSDSMLNNFIISYQRDNATRGPLAGAPDVADFGVNIWQPAFKSINGISVAGYFSVGDNPHGTFGRNNYTLSDDLHIVRGSHNLAFGFHGEISKIDINNTFQQPGTFNFNANKTNNAMASFLLGYVYEFHQASGQYFNNRGKFIGFYGQDSWKASRRLTVNYGLRYEPFFPWHEKFNRIGQFNPAAYAAGTRSKVYPNAPAGLLFPGDPGVPQDGVRPVYKDIMPRVGFAWDVFGTGKTSIRGGGGMFFDTRLDGVFNNAFSGSSPFVTSVDVLTPAGGFSNPYQGIVNPFPAPQPPPSNTIFPTQPYITFAPSGNFQVPVYYAWNLTTEQQITSSLASQIAYVGSHGSHVFVSLDINPVVTNSGGQRVYPDYHQQITETSMSGNTSYQSLQASLEKRSSHGLTVLANYTWSKAMDNMPVNTAVTSAGAGNSYVLPVYDANYKYLDIGPSDFDHRNVFSLSYVWLIPALHSGSRLERAVVNGWQTNGILQMRSGGPLTVTSGVDNSGTALNRDRADLVGAPYGPGACSGYTTGLPCKSYLVTSSFAVNPKGTFGDIKKGSLVGPDYVDWDASVIRNFNMNERVSLQFRAEYFNVLNHTNFSDPGTTKASSGSFGRITGANDPRIGQLALKLAF